jgi:iron complex outermembrane receptor protein
LLEKSGVVKGGHLLGRWTHKFSDRSSTDLLGYCDWNSRNTEKFIELRNTCDVQFQHNYAFTDRHSLTWGGEVLTTSSTQEHDFTVNFIPASERDTASSLFLQYELVVIPSKLRIVAGSKFGNNSFTGFEYQPQVRAVWSLRKNQNFWGAVSRVVAVPNQSQRSIQAPLVELSPVPPTFLIITGNPNLSAEVEHAFETGYRYERKDKVSFDGAIYYNHFYHLIGNVAEPPLISFSPFYVNIPSRFSNLGPGQTHGLELEIKYAPVRRWSLSTAITELRGNSVPGLGIPAVSADPRHMVSVQSRLDLTRLINFDCGYYYYDAANSLPPVNRVDVGGSTKSVRGFTFSVWGRNLQTARHQEASDLILPFGDVRRSVTFKLTWESKTEQKSPSP